MKKRTGNIDDGLLGNPAQINPASDDFKRLKSAILAKSREFSPTEKVEIELNAIKYKMMEYLEDDSDSVVHIGNFIKQCLKTTKVRQRAFAAYIKMNPGNLTKVLTGARKINYDLAIILGTTFRVSPIIWLRIQDKNEIVQLKRANKDKYRNFSLDRLYEVSSHKTQFAVKNSDYSLRDKNSEKV